MDSNWHTVNNMIKRFIRATPTREEAFMRKHHEKVVDIQPIIEKEFGGPDLLPFEGYIFASSLSNIQEILELRTELDEINRLLDKS
jgi:hypothetical protein